MININIHKALNSSKGIMNLQVDLKFPSETFVTLYGKSGAGKTSILRILAGLMEPEKGQIKIQDEIWFDHQKKINLRPQLRKAGLVFQDYALFPNMTVKENLLFALSKNQDEKIIEELIDIIELDGLQSLKPTTLSGGQKQRVALARALVQKPDLLLLDEPLSALDNEMRVKLQKYLLKVHREFKLTTILISHDLSEIIKMSDLVYQIEEGQIINQGSPTQLFTQTEEDGRFQFTGELVAIRKEESIFHFTILNGKDIVKIQVNQSDVSNLNIGDKVVVNSKLSNPGIRKIH